MGKKRARVDTIDLDAERTLYTSFVSAANSMSQLYSQAVQQQRKSSAAASRQTLERVLGFLLKEYGSSDLVPKAALLQFLQQEYEAVDGSEHLPHQFPVQMLPTVAQGSGLEQQVPVESSKPPVVRSPLLSPTPKRSSHAAMPGLFSAMDTADHERSMDTSMPLHEHQQNNMNMNKFGGFGAC